MLVLLPAPYGDPVELLVDLGLLALLGVVFLDYLRHRARVSDEGFDRDWAIQASRRRDWALRVLALSSCALVVAIWLYDRGSGLVMPIAYSVFIPVWLKRRSELRTFLTAQQVR